MTYADAMKYYGTDKPDIRFEMKFIELKGDVGTTYAEHGFNVFDEAELVAGINATGCSEYTRKELDALTEFVRRPQIGAKGLVYVKCNKDGSFKSSVDKFYTADDLKKWAERFNAKAGDLLLILAGAREKTQKALSELRLEMGNRLGLRNSSVFAPALGN